MSKTTSDHYRDGILYIKQYGERVMRRGMWIEEYDGMTLHFDMNDPVVTTPQRHLSYGLMFEEALGVLRGDCRVTTLAKHAKRYLMYSDDGKYLNGAYGPMFLMQRRYVLDTLLCDLASRQAVMTFWRPSPRASLDIPCTVSLQFLVKWIGSTPRLDLIVFMRSSDAYLGIPYDVFTFSMVAAHVLLSLRNTFSQLRLGLLTIMIGSYHVYERDLQKIAEFIGSPEIREYSPIITHDLNTPDDLELRLESLRDAPETIWTESRSASQSTDTPTTSLT